jgi:hypothetical protein
MLRKFQLKQNLFILSVLVLLACNKSTDNPELVNFSIDQIPNKVEKYLDTQNSVTNQFRNEKLKALKNALLFEKTWVEERSSKEKLIIVPINPSFRPPYILNPTSITNLVLTMANDGAIIAANIIQFHPEDERISNLPKNTFSKVFEYQNINIGGRFSVLSLAGLFKYDLSFKKGSLSMVRENTTKLKYGVSARENTTCTDWYLVTTTYDEDHNVLEVDWEFLTRTCDDCSAVGPGGTGTLCDELEGGSGTSNIDYEYAINQPAIWTVEKYTNYWQVDSKE